MRGGHLCRCSSWTAPGWCLSTVQALPRSRTRRRSGVPHHRRSWQTLGRNVSSRRGKFGASAVRKGLRAALAGLTASFTCGLMVGLRRNSCRASGVEVDSASRVAPRVDRWPGAPGCFALLRHPIGHRHKISSKKILRRGDCGAGNPMLTFASRSFCKCFRIALHAHYRGAAQA